MRNMFATNTYAAPCYLCGAMVDEGSGRLFATKAPDHLKRSKIEWKVAHKKKKCATIRESRTVQKEPKPCE